MNILYPHLLLIVLLTHTTAAQVAVKEVVAPQTDKVKSSTVAMIAEQESVKAEDGGYLANPSIVDCFAEMSYQYTGGRYDNETIKFRLRSPDKVKPGKKYPLIVWLHGAGESGSDNSRQLSHMQYTMEIFSGPNKLDFYMLVTQCPEDNNTWDRSVSNEGKGDAPLTILMEILDCILDDFPIDKNCVSVVGLCSGAQGGWSLLKAKPNFFSAVVAIATTPPNGLSWHEHCNGTSLWAFNNRQDEGVPIEPMRNFVNLVRQSGELAYLTERDGGHEAHILAMRQDKAIAWLVKQDRTKITPPPGLVIYVHNNMWRPFYLFVLPVLLLISLILLKIFRWRRSFSPTPQN